MSLQVELKKHILQFNFEAGTSRGVMKSKDSWIIKVFDQDQPEVVGMGEASLIPGLSIDASEDFEEKLQKVASDLQGQPVQEIHGNYKSILSAAIPNKLPSIKFAFEVAILDWINGGNFIIFDNAFAHGRRSIPINGLIWMGSQLFMLKQVREKVKAGFHCIKIKVGAIDFQSECDLLEFVREQYPKKNIELRLDANGAFAETEVFDKLQILTEFKIHSIEQPIAPGNYELMAEICAKSPIPIALDEELIGLFSHEEKINMLKQIKPHYIILKPSLLGGFEACREWISLAESLGIGWWVTSALESNIGLNAIAQFTAEYDNPLPQGLGTGMLYQNNFPSPLVIDKGMLTYDKNISWKLEL
ncbi:MAG: o-succinylbenzoate synthase [Cyclobacteriaceae bacterium]